ncbi:MAG: NUDIX hydrolase [Parasporobacterium sp.]|nr:NUDIX hydrolase [Parasporobacterium sp.]
MGATHGRTENKSEDIMQDESLLIEKQAASENVFNGVMLNIFKDTVDLPNGHQSTREVVRAIGAVAVVALREDGCIAMERQFRYPLNRVIDEIPAGKLNSKEEIPVEAAKRELMEETGILAAKWTDLGKFHPAAAYCDEVLTLFLAEDLSYGEQKLDEDEFLNFEFVPMEEVIADIMSGKITDAKTQSAVLKAYYYIRSRKQN